MNYNYKIIAFLSIIIICALLLSQTKITEGNESPGNNVGKTLSGKNILVNKPKHYEVREDQAKSDPIPQKLHTELIKNGKFNSTRVPSGRWLGTWQGLTPDKHYPPWKVTRNPSNTSLILFNGQWETHQSPQKAKLSTEHDNYHNMLAWHAGTTDPIIFSQDIPHMLIGTYLFSIWLTPRQTWYSNSQSVNVTIGGTPVLKTCIRFTDKGTTTPWANYKGTYICKKSGPTTLNINVVSTSKTSASGIFISSVSLKRTSVDTNVPNNTTLVCKPPRPHRPSTPLNTELVKNGRFDSKELNPTHWGANITSASAVLNPWQVSTLHNGSRMIVSNSPRLAGTGFGFGDIYSPVAARLSKYYVVVEQQNPIKSQKFSQTILNMSTGTYTFSIWLASHPRPMVGNLKLDVTINDTNFLSSEIVPSKKKIIGRSTWNSRYNIYTGIYTCTEPGDKTLAIKLTPLNARGFAVCLSTVSLKRTG